MSIGSELYEQRIEAGEEKTRAKLIAAAFDRFEARQFHLKEVVTQSQVREMEPRLQNEVASVRLEAKSLKRENSGVAGRLRKAIRRVKLEIKETEAKLQRRPYNQFESSVSQIRENGDRLVDTATVRCYGSKGPSDSLLA